MRHIVLDTETTGLDPLSGHKIIEIGCVELYNYIPTGKTYQQYVNPKRPVPQEAFAVHGLSEDFLKPFPTFVDIYKGFIAFIGSSPLVIHNAAFDIKFINAELGAVGWGALSNSIIDTLDMARKRFPGSPANLDALCKKFQINNTHRQKHGALLDAEILAEVYLELKGGRQQFLLSTLNTLEQERSSKPLNFAQTLSSLQEKHKITFGEKYSSLFCRTLGAPSPKERAIHNALFQKELKK